MSAPLFCYICRGSIVSPIKQCTKGHSLCKNCIAELKSCRVCYSTVNTVTYNQMGAGFTVELKNTKRTAPCINADRGCTYDLFLNKKQSHELECKFRAFECEGKSYCNWNCNWIGDYEEIVDHFRNIHSCGMKYKTEGAILIDFQRNSVDLAPIDFFDGYALFWYKHKVDVEKRMVYWSIQFVGLKKHAQQYYYEFEIYDGSTRKLKTTEFCQGHVKDADSLFESQNCVAVSFKKIEQFLNPKGYLTFRFRVLKLKRDFAGLNSAQEPISEDNPILFKEPKSKLFKKSFANTAASCGSGKPTTISHAGSTNSETWSYIHLLVFVCFLIISINDIKFV